MTRTVAPVWSWEWSHTVAVVCDHVQQPEVAAPVREVARIVGADRGAWRLPRALRPGEVAAWDEAAEDTERRHWAEVGGTAQQTFFGALHDRLDGLPAEVADDVLRDPAARERLLTGRSGRPMSYGTRWRFHCPDCGDTLPLAGGKLEPALDAMVAGGLSRVTLAQLRRVALR